MLKQKIQFESFDLAGSGFVRPSAVLRRLQQIAREDLLSFGVSYQDMREKNQAFVVSRMALSFARPVRGEVPLFLTSAANPTHGATFPRSFLIEDENGVLVRANSQWALLDFEKRSLLRASAFPWELPAFEDLSEGLICERLAVPKMKEPIYSDVRRVYPSMLDQNCHLNNCNYADLATDLFPCGTPEVKEIQISFQKEAKLGEELLINAYREESGAYLVSGSFADREETCFLCKIKLFEESYVLPN
jgi:acyl-ACP thioesterase